jgi:regulator of protease activity HflC (stomatin/prohibitin superfamily)
MDTLEPLQYGITYNKITKVIGKDIYVSGRYLIGPTKSFIVYPANLVTIEFSDSRKATNEALKTRTGEGLSISLHVSFQYKIMKEKIPDLYNLANINYQGTYIRIARDTILKIAGKYNATSYWTERLKIQLDMKDNLSKELQSAFASCEGLQILKCELPKQYEDSIVSTQVEVQKSSMRKFEQTAELIRQNISVLRSEAEQKIRVTKAEGDAEAYRIKQFAEARANNNTINAESEVYKLVAQRIGFNETELPRYVFLSALGSQKNSDAKLLVGLQNSIINFGNTPATAGGNVASARRG